MGAREAKAKEDVANLQPAEAAKRGQLTKKLNAEKRKTDAELKKAKERSQNKQPLHCVTSMLTSSKLTKQPTAHIDRWRTVNIKWTRRRTKDSRPLHVRKKNKRS